MSVGELIQQRQIGRGISAVSLYGGMGPRRVESGVGEESHFALAIEGRHWLPKADCTLRILGKRTGQTAVLAICFLLLAETVLRSGPRFVRGQNVQRSSSCFVAW